MTRTFLDSGVLIALVRGEQSSALFHASLSILNDPDRVFIASDIVRLEVLPKPHFHGRSREVTILEAYFRSVVSEWVSVTPQLAERAYEFATDYGLGACDALHIAAADIVGADDFITIEKRSRPTNRISAPKVTTLFPDPNNSR